MRSANTGWCISFRPSDLFTFDIAVCILHAAVVESLPSRVKLTGRAALA